MEICKNHTGGHRDLWIIDGSHYIIMMNYFSIKESAMTTFKNFVRTWTLMLSFSLFSVNKSRLEDDSQNSLSACVLLDKNVLWMCFWLFKNILKSLLSGLEPPEHGSIYTIDPGPASEECIVLAKVCVCFVYMCVTPADLHPRWDQQESDFEQPSFSRSVQFVCSIISWFYPNGWSLWKRCEKPFPSTHFFIPASIFVNVQVGCSQFVTGQKGKVGRKGSPSPDRTETEIIGSHSQSHNWESAISQSGRLWTARGNWEIWRKLREEERPEVDDSS